MEVQSRGKDRAMGEWEQEMRNSRSQREAEGKDERHSGWQAQITIGPWAEGQDAEPPIAKTREEADRVAASVGCTVEAEEDAENGLWIVRIPDAALLALDEDEWWDGTSEIGSVLIELP
jgi:hypothetical protein